MQLSAVDKRGRKFLSINNFLIRDHPNFSYALLLVYNEVV